MPYMPLVLALANLCAAAGLRAIKPNLWTALVLAFVVIVVSGWVGSNYGEQVLTLANRGRDHAIAATGGTSDWPPHKGLPFPDQSFVDVDGQSKRLADFRGKVVLLHVIGTSSRTSIAFAGGGNVGPFQNVTPQVGLDSIAKYVEQYGGIPFDDDRLVVVHLILFNRSMQAPLEVDLLRWERHFEIPRRGNEFVFGGLPALATLESRALIPGFFLIDQESVVRASATGVAPEDDLYLDLLPMIGTLLDASEHMDIVQDQS